MKVERILTTPLVTPGPGGTLAGKIKAEEHGLLTEEAVTFDQHKDQKKESGSHPQYTKHGQKDGASDPESNDEHPSIDLTA